MLSCGGDRAPQLPSRGRGGGGGCQGGRVVLDRNRAWILGAPTVYRDRKHTRAYTRIHTYTRMDTRIHTRTHTHAVSCRAVSCRDVWMWTGMISNTAAEKDRATTEAPNELRTTNRNREMRNAFFAQWLVARAGQKAPYVSRFRLTYPACQMPLLWHGPVRAWCFRESMRDASCRMVSSCLVGCRFEP